MTWTTLSSGFRKLAAREWLMLGLIMLLALALRLSNIGVNSFWIDEIHTFMTTNGLPLTHTLPRFPVAAEQFYSDYLAWRPMDWHVLLLKLKSNVHMPLYYLLLNPWLKAFGNDEAGVRSFSAVCSVLMLVPVYMLGKVLGGREYGRTSGLLAAFVAAVSPFQIYFAQEGRMYALALFWAALSSLCLWKTLYGNRVSRWAVDYSFAVLGGIFTHYMFLFFLVFHALYALKEMIFHPSRRYWALALPVFVALIGLACWYPIYQEQHSGVMEEYHFAKTTVDFSRYLAAPFWEALVVASGDNRLVRVFYMPFTVLLLAAYFWGNRKSFGYRREGFLLGWMLIPVVVQVVYDLVNGTHTSVITRYPLLVAPSVYVLLGLALAWLGAQARGRRLVPVLAAVMVGLAVAAVWAPSPFRDDNNKDDDQRARIHWMASQARPGDLVIATGPFASGNMVAYYLHGHRPDQPMLYWVSRYNGQEYPLPDKTTLAQYDRVWLFRLRAKNELGLQKLKDYLDGLYPRSRKENDWFIYSKASP